METVDQINNKGRKPKRKPKRPKKWKLRPYCFLEEKKLSMLNRNSELKQDKDNKLKAKEYLYGQSIAAEICNFGEVDRCMTKKETNNIIFKYQIKK